MTQRTKRLDKKDRAILNALEQLGGKASAEQVADVLKPSMKGRTVRYRIQRLRETGFLETLIAQTHETKIGLGDCKVLLEHPTGKQEFPRSIFSCFPMFYATNATFGKYNGTMISGGFGTQAPEVVSAALDAFYERGLIDGHRIIENVDYVSMNADFTRIAPTGKWEWDWRDWVEKSEELIRSEKVFRINMDLEQSPVDFDHTDVMLLAELKRDASATLRELGRAVGLSEPQVADRQRRLESKGIIKGWRWMFADVVDKFEVYLFFGTETPFHPVLNAMNLLPFPRELFAESDRSFTMKIHMPSTYVTGLIRGATRLRPHLTYLFLQTATDAQVQPWPTLYDCYSRRSKRWEFDVEEYIAKMEESL